MITRTDENGTIHSYLYDALGRVTGDIVSTLGTGIDGALRRVGTTYNTQGQIDRITNYSDVAAITVTSELARQYNGLMQTTREYQSVAGAVNTATTPPVDYAFSEMAAEPTTVALLRSLIPAVESSPPITPLGLMPRSVA